MKIQVKREDMIDCLQKVQSVINVRNTLPILSNVLFRSLGQDQLELTATDADLTVRAVMPATILEGGATTLPAKRIFGVFREVGTSEVEMEVNAENQASIHAGSSYFRVNGISEDEYPSLPEIADAKTFTLEQASLRNMLRLTSYAASPDTNRQLLHGVLMSFRGGKLSVVATDSRRLAVVDEEVEFPADSEMELIVPLKTVEELVRTLGDEGDVTVSANPRQVSFEFGGTLVISKLVEGVYPNFRQVIPQAGGERVFMDRETMLTAIRRTSQLVSDTVSSIKLNFAKDQVEVLAEAADIGEGRETVAVRYAGPELVIAFNPAFLMEPLKAITQDEVYLDLIDDTNPGVIRTNISFVYVLMPIRAN